MKFRIKHIEGIGYWPHVKMGFWNGWQKIAKYNDGFGLYEHNNTRYPNKSEEECQRIITDFVKWLPISNGKPTYKEVTVNVL